MKILFHIIIFIVFSCAAYAEDSSKSIVDNILSNGVIVNPDSNTNDILNKLGKPTEIQTKAVDNLYSDIDDELSSITYMGLSLLVYTTKSLENNWSKVSKVSVKGNNYLLPYNIKIGTNKSDLINILGKPHQINDNYWYYYSSDNEPHLQLILIINNNKLQEFIWSYMP